LNTPAGQKSPEIAKTRQRRKAPEVPCALRLAALKISAGENAGENAGGECRKPSKLYLPALQSFLLEKLNHPKALFKSDPDLSDLTNSFLDLTEPFPDLTEPFLNLTGTS
jgi:hypothetical protein